MLKDNLVVLTEEEYEALQDSRFAELPALLVGDLRHALESATPDTRMGCLLRNLLPYLRKPQVPAEVIAEARRWAQNLRQWRRTATPTEDGFRLITEDCLRRCSAAFDALLTAVEAAPEPAPEPAPDFAAMSPDELRAWLDKRGRLYEGRGSGEEVLFHAWFGGGGAVGAGSGSTREAALLALCQKIAAEEAS